jgi:uncharacterized membrane protein
LQFLDDAAAVADRFAHRVEMRIRRWLVWNNIYRTTSYLRSALWMVPLLSIVLVLAIAPGLRILDGWLGWRLTGLSLSGARSLYETVITLTLSFVVFTFGSLLVAIQIAGGQLTPHIIATTLLRDTVVRYSVGLFVFTLIFAVMALNRVETSAHEIVAFVTSGLGIACMATFLFLIDHAARLLRPVTILARVGDEGLAVITAVYPRVMRPDEPTPSPEIAALPAGPRRVVAHAGRSEFVLAVDMATLVREARRRDGVIELMPQVGDYVATDDELMTLYGGAVAIDDEMLQAAVAFGSERTMEQDPLFGLRIMVDIALKALSPAINDPTTAVLAIDQIHRLLRVTGRRTLSNEDLLDRSGKRRVIYRTPDWEDFVQLACTEIRSCGAGNVQVARRLRAMLDGLIPALPAERRPALEHERDALTRMLPALYAIPEDLALASMPDPQGLGGSVHQHPARPAAVSQRVEEKN